MFKTILKGLDGTNLTQNGKDLSVGLALSQVLVSGKSTDALRAYSLSLKLYAEEDMELNESDKAFVLEALKKTEIYTPLVVGQIELLLK